MFVSEIFAEAAEILGTTDESKVFRALTQACAALMESGHWFHTQQEVDVCTGWDGMTITLPRGIEVPLAVNIDGSPTYFRNRYFQYHINKGGRFNPVSWAWDDRGFVATLMDIKQPSQLVAVAESENDVGKTIRVVGTDSNNRALRSQLNDGTGVDGLLLKIHSQSDFQYGTIAPDNATIVTRSAAIDPLTKFSSPNHQLTAGAAMELGVVSGEIPTALVDGQVYYVGVVDGGTLQLYTNEIDAQNARYPIALSSIEGAGVLSLTDSRVSNVLTAIQFSETPAIAISTANEVTFSGSPLPAPLETGKTYYANSLGDDQIQVFASLVDAQNNQNPIYLTGSTASFDTTIRKEIAPQTQLKFGVLHYFNDGDLVQANTNGGSLPSPLLTGQNYYVHVIDPTTVSLHETNADALAGQNSIVLTSAGSGVNSLVKLIPASVNIGTSNNIVAPGLVLQPATGAGATADAIVAGPVVDVNVLTGGNGYSSAPSVDLVSTGGNGYTANPTVKVVSNTGVSANITSILNVAGKYISGVNIVAGGSNYVIGDDVVFIGGNGKGAAGHVSAVSPLGAITGIIIDPVGSGAVAHAIVVGSDVTDIVLDAPGNGYVVNPRVVLSGGGASIVATAVSVIQTSYISSFVVTNGGSGYGGGPSVSISSSVGGSGATAIANVQNGVVKSIEVIAAGTGYTAAPTVVIKASTGAFVNFSTTGSFPSPLLQGVSYRAEAPFTTESFTVVNADFTPISITSVGTGNFFVALSRTFSIDFTDTWAGQYVGLATGDEIFFGTDYLLPTTVPAIDEVTPYYLRKLTDSSASIFDSEAHALAIPSTTGRIAVTNFGTGQSYFGVKVPSAVTTASNIIVPSSLQYLSEDMRVKFSSTGTLPTPLQAATEYTIKFSGAGVKVYDSNLLVNLLSPGIGILKMNIIRAMEPIASTKLIVADSLYVTGQSLIARSNVNDSLPNPLVSGTDYFVRRLDNDSFELYNTLVNSKAAPSITGRISYQTAGETADSIFFVDAVEPPILAKSILHVEKPITSGFVSLYAYDYGRDNDLTLIGQYHPTEQNPKYRRIRIGQKCAWARILYRVKSPTITSQYDYLPLEQERAIITAVHAVDLENKDFMDQALKYWNLAFGYLRNQQNSMEGHAMATPQVNNITYGDGTDVVLN